MSSPWSRVIGLMRVMVLRSAQLGSCGTQPGSQRLLYIVIGMSYDCISMI